MTPKVVFSELRAIVDVDGEWLSRNGMALRESVCSVFLGESSVESRWLNVRSRRGKRGGWFGRKAITNGQSTFSFRNCVQ